MSLTTFIQILHLKNLRTSYSDVDTKTLMKQCKDCKYFRPNRQFHFHETRVQHGICMHPSARIIDAGSGASIQDRADNMRYEDPDVPLKYHGKCGATARFFHEETNMLLKRWRMFSVFDVINVVFDITVNTVFVYIIVYIFSPHNLSP
jgi:hypothetical protein